MKKNILCVIITVFILALLTGCGKKAENGEIVVYNWGEYIDPEVIDMFQEETGIKVIYDEFETNEEMYPKVEAGAVVYDVVCPSDYMIEKMIQNNLLAELDYSNMKNYDNIGSQYLKACEAFDPENKYCMPYMWGTVGILYDKTKVSEPVKSWDILWDEKYAGEIIMQRSVRDAFAVALKKDGYSLNSTNKDELLQAQQELSDQKPLVQAYYVDEVRDAMIGGDAALAVIYSGEATYTKSMNENLEYAIPEEGTNLWFDGWVIPKNCNNKEGALQFIDFLNRPDVAQMNFKYITYSTPNTAVQANLDKDTLSNTALFPDENCLENSEVFHFLGDDMESYYNTLWKEIKAD